MFFAMVVVAFLAFILGALANEWARAMTDDPGDRP
jgi:hypothetical protein